MGDYPSGKLAAANPPRFAMAKRILAWISRIGAGPNETDDLRIRRMIFVGASLGGVLSLIGYGVVFGVFGAPLAAAVMFAYWGICLLNLTAFGVARRCFETFLSVLLVTHMIASLLITLVLGGLIPSAMHAVWGLLGPLGAIVVYGPRTALGWFAGYAALIAAGIYVSYGIQIPVNALDPEVISALMGVNIIGASAFAFGILYYFVQQRDLAFGLLHGERERSEELLLNILPKEVVAVLKNQPRIIADHFAGATILFADVVNFTPISARLSPTELVDLLNEVFSHFDALVEKYGVEKIKTIGDCYMVASGVPRPRSDHAHVLTRLALEMRDFVNQREFYGDKLSLRIGLNSGPVVAGVIGRKKFIYDLWGDAVNTASRMESHGSSGVIQITRATYDLIKDRFRCEYLGALAIKGKGAMDVWQVCGDLLRPEEAGVGSKPESRSP
jgi:guanylate cyclase